VKPSGEPDWARHAAAERESKCHDSTPFSELSIAVVYCIEAMRIVRQLAEIPQVVLKLIGQAACSERAIYWTVDPVAARPRVAARWGALSTLTPSSDWAIRHRAASLREDTVEGVWRSGKPLWSASFVLDTALPSAFEASEFGAVWFAIKTDSAVYAVIELLGRALEATPPDNLVFVEQLGYRLGYALEELRPGGSRGRFPWSSPSGIT
jgi:hypothetical protein